MSTPALRLPHCRAPAAALNAGSSAQQRPALGAPAVAARRQRRRAAPLPRAALDAALPAAASEALVDPAAAVAPAADAAGSLAAAAGAAPAAAPAVSEALAAAQAAAESDPTDLIFTALFTIAVAALTVVTLGVAYLSFTSWNDSRLEQEDRRRAESFRPSSNGAGPSNKKAESKKAAAAKKAEEEFKGFGKK